jgi:pantoate--beta-alanine ligase
VSGAGDDGIVLLDSLAAVRAARETLPRPLGLVPTMGNLHAGHLELVRRSRAQDAATVVSIFVNPLQFGPGEDFERYPRTFAEDRALLAEAGVAAIFCPAVQDLYPAGTEAQTRVCVPGLSEALEGASRPGHFDGVTTVVARLFGLVRPDRAWFGEKDFQQLALIRRMVRDLELAVRIEGVPLVRADDGLALSSRNRYLSDDERAKAPALYHALRTAAEALAAGARPDVVEAEALATLSGAGFDPDYVAVRAAQDLGAVRPDTRELVVLGAARLGATRLIDNVQVVRPS